MKISVHAMSVELLTTALENMSAVLAKGLANASARKFDPNVLVTSRLAPDMLPLSKQVQIACDITKNSLARLMGKEPPRFDDNEKTLDELRERIARTLDFVKSIPAAALEGSEDRDIKVPAGERTLEFKGLAFLQRWAIPNVFFHVTTAYNILRQNGVDIGKKDFLGPL